MSNDCSHFVSVCVFADVYTRCANICVCVCVRVNEIRSKGKEQIRRSYRKDRKPKRLAAPSQIHTLTPNDLSKDLFGMQHVNTAINICAGDAAYTLVYATPANSECECDGIKKEWALSTHTHHTRESRIAFSTANDRLNDRSVCKCCECAYIGVNMNRENSRYSYTI